jgi:pyruvate dehydrogenase E1 component beta subunit
VGPWLAQIPGLRVLVASTPGQAAGLLRFALASRSPTVLLEPRALYADRGPVLDTPTAPAQRVVREGRHVTLATWGAGVQATRDAADRLAAEGIDAEVLDLVQLAPLDTAALGERVRATGRLVVVHPDDPTMAHHVRAAAADAAFLFLESPLTDAPADAARIARVALDSVRY